VVILYTINLSGIEIIKGQGFPGQAIDINVLPAITLILLKAYGMMLDFLNQRFIGLKNN